MKIVAFLTCTLISANLYAWGAEKICTVGQARGGSCDKGDILKSTSNAFAIRLCDFNKNVVVLPGGEIVCFFVGFDRLTNK